MSRREKLSVDCWASNRSSSIQQQKQKHRIGEPAVTAPSATILYSSGVVMVWLAGWLGVDGSVMGCIVASWLLHLLVLQI